MDIVEYAQKMRAERLHIEPDVNKTIKSFVECVENAIHEDDVPAAFGVETNLLINVAEILKKDRWTPTTEGLPVIPEEKGGYAWVDVIVTDRHGQVFTLMYHRQTIKGKTVYRWRRDLSRLYYGDVVAWRYLPESWKGGEA